MAGGEQHCGGGRVPTFYRMGSPLPNAFFPRKSLAKSMQNALKGVGAEEVGA